jgi:sulfate-transporting ATPase
MPKQDEPNKAIYSMAGVGTVHGTKQVLKDIVLGYFYGAKIGVIGLNGSGKSTLLRIMAGVEKEFIGEVAISPGYSVGFLEQEPQLDPDKTVLEVVREGAAEPVSVGDPTPITVLGWRPLLDVRKSPADVRRCRAGAR